MVSRNKTKKQNKRRISIRTEKHLRDVSTDTKHYLASFIPEVLIFLDQEKNERISTMQL